MEKYEIEYTTYEEIAKELDINIEILTRSIADYGDTNLFFDIGNDGIYHLKKYVPDTRHVWKEIASCLSSTITLDYTYSSKERSI